MSTNSIAMGAATPSEMREIKRFVFGKNRKGTGLPKHKDRLKLGWHYVYLKADLPAASNPLTGYTQAAAAICMYVDGQDTLDMEEITNTDLRITITNRSTTTGASSGDFILVRWNLREWMPVWISSASAFRHGIVTANLGCGYYTIELALWTGDLNTSGSGIGSDTSSGIDSNCDVCYDITGYGTADCAITLSYPPLQVTGTGVFVTAYHRASALVPLRLGTACYLTGSGTDEASSSGTSSGSETPPSIWQIVDGLQEHTVQYINEEDCCDGEGETGTYTILTKTPIIFAAKVCAPIPCGSCSTPSSG